MPGFCALFGGGGLFDAPLALLGVGAPFIPDGPDWRKQDEGEDVMIYFWGTLFAHPNGDHCVLHMEWNGASWNWSCSSIQNWWLVHQPAALLEA